MTPKLFDVHTHIQFAAFSGDADSVMRRALDLGVWMVNVGTQKDTSKRAVEIAEQYSEGVYATVGLHPVHTEKSYHDAKELGDSEAAKGFTSRGEDFDFDFYKSLGSHEKVVGIGECGLDYYRLEEETKKKQERVFLEHIRLSYELKKPLMIHCRKAFGDLIQILETHKADLPDRRGIVHFFSGTVRDTKKLLDLGFSFSFGGVITFARDYDEVIEYIPLDRIVLETDAPYVTPTPHRGKRNEPSFVVEVEKKLSELKGIPFDEIASLTTKNAMTLFFNIIGGYTRK